MDLARKLSILADAAKYDASCASSGAPDRRSSGDAGIGSTSRMGICHSYAPDGRCISLLKILLTNFCLYDCQYCVNRRSSDVPRARFAVEEVVQLTLDFYRRNYIEGLFLSSGIIRSPDYTMEELTRVARTLRKVHDFRGYIHLKTIPDADERLIAAAGRYADRLSVNIEMPAADSLTALAPEKNATSIRVTMGRIRVLRDEAKAEARAGTFAPAGQSTQLIVGADASTDQTVLRTAETLYGAYRLRRVYYSAFSPIPHASAKLPTRPPPLLREHRLYQADWLLRHYGFGANEIVVDASGGLDLELDPKLAWALAHRECFPVDLNRAAREVLLRVPGLGTRNVKRLIAMRRHRKIRYADLVKLRCDTTKASPFVITVDYRPPLESCESKTLRSAFLATPRQAGLFDAPCNQRPSSQPGA
jgi:putative DNA modification/repair radical SAM protein